MQYFFNKKNLLALIFIIVGFILLKESYTERGVYYISADELGPMTYPRYLLWGWISLSVLYLLMPPREFDLSNVKSSMGSFTYAVVSIVVFYLLFQHLGLFFSTFIFLIIFFYIMGLRNLKKVLSVAFLLSFSAWIVFEKILDIPMPSAIWNQFI